MTHKFFRPQIMGVLNITTDSFYDGNKYLKFDEAIEHAIAMIGTGASIIDIGGESSRPRAMMVDVETEVNRVLPVVKHLRSISDVLISVDTYHARTARLCLSAGANIINDISAMRFDPDMLNVLIEFPDARIVLMHMQGTPATMQDNPYYDDVVSEIESFFRERIRFCESNGIRLDRLIIDPGIGFGKMFDDNIAIIQNLHCFKELGLPVLIGASRKSFINEIYESTPDERLVGSLAMTAICGMHSVDIVRVHDVREHHQMIESLYRMS
jgi:dihydropteroate synthase